MLLQGEWPQIPTPPLRRLGNAWTMPQHYWNFLDHQKALGSILCSPHHALLITLRLFSPDIIL